MRRFLFAAIVAASSAGAHASCLSVASEASSYADARDWNVPLKQTLGSIDLTSNYSAQEKANARQMATLIYSRRDVKPWHATELANSVCGQKTAQHPTPTVVQNDKCPFGAVAYGGGMYECVKSRDEQRAADAEAEKRAEIAYRDSFNRIQSIPGICTGDDCKQVRKVQRWDARTGAMLN